MLKKISPLLLTLLFALACSSLPKAATPTALMPEAAGTSLKQFDSLTLNTPGVLEITQGSPVSLQIHGDPAYLAVIEIKVTDGRLTISTNSNIPSNASITYQLTVEDIHDIELNSFSVIKIPRLKTNQLGIQIHGTGRIQAGELTADSLRVEMNGGGNFSAESILSAAAVFSSRGAGNISIAAGSADHLNLSIELGTFIGDNFKTTSAEVAVNGAGSVLVWAVKELSVVVNGAGSVTYYGEPMLNMSMSGGGKIVGGGKK